MFIFREPKSVDISPVWDKNSKILFLGSITAIDGMNKGFYYASGRNQFWKILDYVFFDDESYFKTLQDKLKINYEDFIDKKITEKEFKENRILIQNEFKELLLKNNIAICDVFENCYFKNNTSLDSDIILKDEKYGPKLNDKIIQEIVSNSQIDKVVTNSVFVSNVFKKMNIKGDYKLIEVISPSTSRRVRLDIKKEEWKNKICNI
ncbi:MAG: hypothetical protein IJ008_03830 [Clostridia bacterium]|nr:hypothetical protein [Clostridia bacterium]